LRGGYYIVSGEKVAMISADLVKGKAFWLAGVIFVVIIVLQIPCNPLSAWL
jgi:hypothetical protein